MFLIIKRLLIIKHLQPSRTRVQIFNFIPY